MSQVKFLGFLLGLSLYGMQPAHAAPTSVEQLGHILALQDAKLAELEKKLDSVSTPDGQWVSRGQVIINKNRQWLSSAVALKGPRGDQGPAGRAGANGPDGSPGPTGFEGLRGDSGAPGARGQAGPVGPKGIVGEKGPRCFCGAEP